MREMMAVGGGRPVPGVDGLSEGLVLLYTGHVAEARETAAARVRESDCASATAGSLTSAVPSSLSPTCGPVTMTRRSMRR